MLTSLVFESAKFEAAIGYNFFESHGSGDANSANGSNDQQALEIRGGLRWDLGNSSFLNYGLDYSPTWGSQNGQSLAGDYTVGPYVGFSRQFTKSNVVFTAFVIPYEYQYTRTPAGSSIATAYFIDGGVGIDYLF